MKSDVEAFFDERTNTVTYVVSDPATRRAAIIDPVLGYEANSGRTGTDSADKVIAFVRERGLAVDWILETHIHADHLTAAPYLHGELGGRIVIGDRIGEVQRTFAELFNVESGFVPDGSQFDRLLADGDRLALGELEIRALHTPGHTPACLSYVVSDAVFVGDTIFMPDFGTARCDFPGGDAETLYDSIQRILDLPAATRLFVGHDYGGEGRGYAWETTVGEQRECNRHVGSGIAKVDFVAMRRSRDEELDLPALILPAIQVNMRAGQLPPPEDNGIRYLKIPFNAL